MSKCRCDKFIHPPIISIKAGLRSLPRQVSTFPEFRLAMLSAISEKAALADWRGRDNNDLGIMLLEMWAYVADVQSFYDEVIANEEYIRTSQRRPSLRKLVYLLGYIPKPAVASSVKLAVLAEGRKPIMLPPGTAFRSRAFDGEKPQVFELEKNFSIHPLNNSWMIAAPQPFFIGSNNPHTLNILPDGELSSGMPILIRTVLPGIPPNVQTILDYFFTNPRQIVATAQKTDFTGENYLSVKFDGATKLQWYNPVNSVLLFTPKQKASLWTISSSPPAVETVGARTRLTLDGVYQQVKAGDLLLVQHEQEYRWFRVNQVDEQMRKTSTSLTVTINGSNFSTPGVSTPVTRVLLDTNLNDATRKVGSANWDNSHRKQITVHYNLVLTGKGYAPPRATLVPNDPLKLEDKAEAPLNGQVPDQFLFEDKNQDGVSVRGVLDYLENKIILDMGESWSPPLNLPVKAYGNTIKATRGETVSNEILGSGDATQANQAFTLKKSPLTYLAAPGVNNQGAESTLRVYVDDVQWQEIPSFFGADPDDKIYILRQDDEGKTTITFGDGVRGARLPSGTNNLSATYRYGAGKAAPPAGGISQLARPVQGLRSVRSPLKASGGEDAETTEKLRQFAPRSALLLGRVVSIDDMIVVASGVSGVRAAHAEWRWNAKRQQPVVQVWYIGETKLKKSILVSIHALSENNLPVDAEAAKPVPLTLTIDLEVEGRYIKEKVLGSVRSTLLDPYTGLLPPERIGIGKPLYRSQVFKAVLATPGILSVVGLQAAYLTENGPWSLFAITPGAGKYFDIEQGGLILNSEDK
jgi:hypothetical protein